jgi:hypothetical protein
MIELVEAGKYQYGLVRDFQRDFVKNLLEALASQNPELARIFESGHPLLPDHKRCVH